MALRRNVTMSNTSSNGEGAKAVDNRTSAGNFDDSLDGTCARTQQDNVTLVKVDLPGGAGSAMHPQPGNWIKVDLGDYFTVALVTLVGRADCCPEESNNLTITIGKTGRLVGNSADEVCKSRVDAGRPFMKHVALHEHSSFLI